MSTKPVIRCAIYTRKSTEEGLEQDFNSLQAQREACEAYITSQRHEGWQTIRTPYDDGGFSGGNMERPALKQLLEDIGAGRINVIVVYKVDRLSRSLHDFARMVEVFDKHNVSFVSVTQQFNTTSSMGRLTLNVLLSFAQFEREVTGERIRDKIAASKKKGMWMGGYAPLGYDIKDRKLIINPTEAETVRRIYRRYLELTGVRELQRELEAQGVCSKVRAESKNPGGVILLRGALYHLLSNPLYIGQIRHRITCYPGQHDAIIDQTLWDRVQQRLADNREGHMTRPRKTAPCPLAGRLFDACGNRLVPVHVNNKGRRYRYYVSESLKTEVRKDAPDGWRLPGQEIERTVIRLGRILLNDRNALTTALQVAEIPAHHIPAILRHAGAMSEADDLAAYVNRVDLRHDGIKLTLSLETLVKKKTPILLTHEFPMLMKRRGFEMRLVIEGEAALNAKPDLILIKTIARAHAWAEELLLGRASSMADIAARNHVSDSYVRKLLPLAFLAPSIIEAIVSGQQPVHLTTQMLLRQINIPLDWNAQKQVLGF